MTKFDGRRGQPVKKYERLVHKQSPSATTAVHRLVRNAVLCLLREIHLELVIAKERQEMFRISQLFSITMNLCIILAVSLNKLGFAHEAREFLC